MLNELIDLYGTCKTDELHCDISKTLRVIQPGSRVPLQSLRAELPLAKSTVKSAAAEALALNKTKHVRHHA